MKAIIFDCDGVLVDSEAIYQEAEVRFLTELGLRIDPKAYAKKFMGLSPDVYYRTLFETYTPELSGGFPEDFEKKLSSYCKQQIEENLRAVPGALPYITSLTVPFAVASSTNLEFLHKKLRMTSMHTHFDPHIYSGEQVARGKPFPDLFLFAANRLGVAPANCVVFEDSVNGVTAGLAAGMRVVGFCGGGHCDASHADVLLQAGAHAIAYSYDDPILWRLPVQRPFGALRHSTKGRIGCCSCEASVLTIRRDQEQITDVPPKRCQLSC
ncbi:MAG: HAD family phosphatase [Devosia sp.]|nr:HAD family phosphatase [Devosia sp.]